MLCIAREQFEYSSGCSVTQILICRIIVIILRHPIVVDADLTHSTYCSMLYESFQCRRARIHNFVKLVPIWFRILSDLSAKELYNCTLFSTFFLRFSCASLIVNFHLERKSWKKMQFFFHDNVMEINDWNLHVGIKECLQQLDFV